jgi:hypothetical protein
MAQVANTKKTLLFHLKQIQIKGLQNRSTCKHFSRLNIIKAAEISSYLTKRALPTNSISAKQQSKYWSVYCFKVSNNP